MRPICASNLPTLQGFACGTAADAGADPHACFSTSGPAGSFAALVPVTVMRIGDVRVVVHERQMRVDV